ncbi:MAG: caspase family protein [Gammaproteobacteria bacterium]|nr:caspase family protein [Gammaproteobacteria bacterium]
MKTLAVGLGVLLSGAASAQADSNSNENDFFLDKPDSTKYAMILAGPTVGDKNKSQFRQWAFSLHDILARDYGYSSDTISLLYDRGELEAAASQRIDAACDLAGIQQELARLQSVVKAGDQITIYLIGHGSGAEEESKFNIVGPDITGVQFASMLDVFEEQDMVIVNTTSASYGFSAALSSEGRVVVSSTRSSSEKFDPIFSKYFIEALDNRNGDRDKNNRVSVLEAFNYAKNSVEEFYEEQGRLASEHAGLDDNGDALFSLNPTRADIDGRLAEIAYIDNLVDDTAGLSAEEIGLKGRMQDLERSVFILRGRKAEFLEEDYWQRMEELLVALARATEQFNEAVNPDESSEQ